MGYTNATGRALIMILRRIEEGKHTVMGKQLGASMVNSLHACGYIKVVAHEIILTPSGAERANELLYGEQ